MKQKSFSKIWIIVIVIILIGGGILAWQYWEMPEEKEEGKGIISGRGTIRYLELEGGFYGIIADTGEHYDPINLEKEFQIDGARIYFEIEEQKDMVSFHMWGDIVKIIKIKKLEDETANWQTYRNEELGFSLRYPSDWQIVNDALAREKRATIFRENLQINNDKVPENPRLYLWVNPIGFGMPGALDIQYTLALSGDKSIKVVERTKFLPHKEGLSNVDGVTAISTGTTRLGVNSYAFFFQFSEGGKDYEPTFNQILSTFRFLE